MKLKSHVGAWRAYLAALPFIVGAGGVALAGPSPSTSAAAEGGANADSSEPLGEVVVTARRREESSLKVPGAMTALSEQMIEAENIQSIDDIAAVSPGLVRDSTTTGSARSDRSTQSLIIRGMTPASGNNVVSVFVNGVPVTDGDIDGVFDFANVEVLKGPQSAYFGRETFAGAVNVVTKDPGNEYHGYVSALGASGDYWDVKGAFEGAIVPDVVTFRATARYYTRNGSWDNEAEPGQKLGDQETKSGSLQINIKPIDDLTIKLYGVYWQDNDGLGATGVILPSQSNCTFPGGKYFCGTLPGLLPGQPSANTAYNAGTAAQLAETGGVLPAGFNPGWGLKRDAFHLSSNIDYAIPSLGITVTSLTGATNDEWGTFFPLNGIASTIPDVFAFTQTLPQYAQPYTNWPFIIDNRNTDFSQEFRVASDQNQRFRWLLGASYLYTYAQIGSTSNYFFGGLSPPTVFNPGYTTTYGAFYSLAFDIVPDLLTLDFDGRYQSDRLFVRNYVNSALANEAEYHNYVPRVSLEYKFTKDALAYFTYSKGVNPGIATDPLLEFPTQADVQKAIAAGATANVKPEFLDNYELGLKGKFLDDRLVIAADVYYDIWSDKIVSDDLLIQNGNAAPSYVTFYTNLGKVNLPGIEGEITAKPVDSFVLNVSGAINSSTIKAGECPSCKLLTGSDNVNGNQLPNYSKYSAQASGEYTQIFAPLPKFKWYERTELTYKSGQYESYGDYAKSPAATNVNFRLGLNGDKINAEAFVTNAFNNKAYTSVLNDWNLSSPTEGFGAYDSVYVGLPYLRTYGLRVRYDF